MSADEPRESRQRHASAADPTAESPAEPAKRTARKPADEAAAEHAPAELSPEGMNRLRARLARKYH
jgi:hypothetical protein